MSVDLRPTLDTFAIGVLKLLGDKELAYANPSERAVVARLSNLLQGMYPGWLRTPTRLIAGTDQS